MRGGQGHNASMSRLVPSSEIEIMSTYKHDGNAEEKGEGRVEISSTKAFRVIFDLY